MRHGKARAIVMRLYFRGEITWHEAADLIGVHHRTIAKWTPSGFEWREARSQYIDKSILRTIKASAKAKRRKSPNLTIIKGGKP